MAQKPLIQQIHSKTNLKKLFFETLEIEISRIRFHIRVARSRIMLNIYFQVIPRKISDFKGNCCLFYSLWSMLEKFSFFTGFLFEIYTNGVPNSTVHQLSIAFFRETNCQSYSKSYRAELKISC